MKMSEVKVGMRLRNMYGYPPITVTEITERGFKYLLDDEVNISPRLGIILTKEGEHYGIDGNACYELIEE